jgi:hypothetical protein
MIRVTVAMRALFVMALFVSAFALASCSSPTEAPDGGESAPAGGGPAGVNEGDIGPVDAPRSGDGGYPRLPTRIARPVDRYAGPTDDDAASGDADGNGADEDAEAQDEASADQDGGGNTQDEGEQDTESSEGDG